MCSKEFIFTCTSRAVFLTHAIIAVFAMRAAWRLTASHPDYVALWDPYPYRLVLYIQMCQIGDGSSIDGDASSGSYHITGASCSNPSFVLHLVSVSSCFSIFALVAYVIAHPLVTCRMGRGGLQDFFKGMLAGLGLLGALLHFLSGWGLIAVGYFVNSFYEAQTTGIQAASWSQAASVVLPTDLWPLFVGGGLMMLSSVLIIVEAVLLICNARKELESKPLVDNSGPTLHVTGVPGAGAIVRRQSQPSDGL